MDIKAYKNYMIVPKANSEWWDIFKDGRFHKMASDEEEARRVIWMETGRGEYITDEMMKPVVIIDPQGEMSEELLAVFNAIKGSGVNDETNIFSTESELPDKT
jgi:hypothetical protein